METGRRRIRFWIEGVGIFVVGIIGFPCNLITVFVLRRYCMRRKNRTFNILIMWLVQINIFEFSSQRNKIRGISYHYIIVFIRKLSFQSNNCWYHTHHWYCVAKISIAAFPKSGRTSLVWANLSNHLASFERDIVEWNNLHDTCCLNRKISLYLLADETEDCKYFTSPLNDFS